MEMGMYGGSYTGNDPSSNRSFAFRAPERLVGLKKAPGPMEAAVLIGGRMAPRGGGLEGIGGSGAMQSRAGRASGEGGRGEGGVEPKGRGRRAARSPKHSVPRGGTRTPAPSWAGRPGPQDPVRSTAQTPGEGGKRHGWVVTK